MVPSINYVEAIRTKGLACIPIPKSMNPPHPFPQPWTVTDDSGHTEPSSSPSYPLPPTISHSLYHLLVPARLIEGHGSKGLHEPIPLKLTSRPRDASAMPQVQNPPSCSGSWARTPLRRPPLVFLQGHEHGGNCLLGLVRSVVGHAGSTRPEEDTEGGKGLVKRAVGNRGAFAYLSWNRRLIECYT